jgi:hypothetical protein
MESAFGVDHGDVAKAFNPIKALRAKGSHKGVNSMANRVNGLTPFKNAGGSRKAQKAARNFEFNEAAARIKSGADDPWGPSKPVAKPVRQQSYTASQKTLARDTARAPGNSVKPKKLMDTPLGNVKRRY